MPNSRDSEVNVETEENVTCNAFEEVALAATPSDSSSSSFANAAVFLFSLSRASFASLAMFMMVTRRASRCD